MRSEDFDTLGKVIYLEKKRAFTSNTQPVFWAVASGKGGVGRSFFTSSLGITLSRLGYRVLMIDCDLNGGSLHSWMGILEKTKNLSDYYRNTDPLSNYLITLSHEKLCMISGDTCLWNCPEGYARSTSDLLKDLKKQPFDIVLFDLSAGYNDQNIELLKSVDDTFLIATPEATSIERTYRWIENYILSIGLNSDNRKILCEFNQKRRTQSGGTNNLFGVRDFLESLRVKETGEGGLFGPIKLVINQARNFEDERLGDSIKSICNKHYFTNLQALGFLNYDNAVWQCARQRAPVLIHQPFNPLVGQIQGLVKQLVDQTSQRAVV